MKNSKFTPKQIRKVHMYLRAAIQLLFFILLPSTFSSAFNGVKYIFTQMGSGESIALTSFVAVLLVTAIYTIVFGRFFCGYACAFGSFGDAVHALYVFICKKLKKKPVQISENVCRILSYVKYAVLLLIVIICFIGAYGAMSGTSPWDVFSMLRSGNFRLGNYIVGIVLLVIIIIGMAFCERFFCRFFCPMGAVFSLLPALPLTGISRKRNDCAKGCKACKNICPAKLELPERGSFEVNGDCFQCGKCIDICPKKNAKGGMLPIIGTEVWFTLFKAIVLAVILILVGV